MISSKDIKVGITQGDPNGIGFEVILKTLQDSRMLELCVPIVYGSQSALKEHMHILRTENLQFKFIDSAEQARHNHPNFISVSSADYKVEIGKGSPESGRSAFLALEKAVEDLKKGEIDVLVTAPINKDNIQSEQFKFPGHTEYLADKDGKSTSLMFMVSDHLKVAVVTGHIPVNEISGKITQDLIKEKITQIENSLKVDFSISKPKIAVLGLNPHAVDNGLLGTEDEQVILPVVNEFRELGMLVYGPFSADGFFGSGKYKNYDAVLAMYHDQGLIPFKTLAFGSGTNFTAGLSFIRTSPDHGTGYEIAGQNVADESSLRQAIYSAIDIYKNRTLNEELKKNSLEIRQYKRERDRIQ